VPVLKIHDDLPKVQADLADAAVRLVEERGTAAIILGSTGFLGCADQIRAHLEQAGHDIPVIDPVPTAIAMASALVALGLSQSRISYPAFERDKAFTGFEAIAATKLATSVKAKSC
jgi:allantoin racemase